MLRRVGIGTFALVVAIILLAASVLMVMEPWEEGAEGKVTVRFFNVGHGYSALIQTPDDRNILIDAGSFDDFSSSTEFLEDLEVTTLHAFIITHPHPDHVSFAADVLEMCDVLSVYMPGNDDNLDPEGWAAVKEAIAAEGCPVYDDSSLNPGDRLDLSDEVGFQLMWIDANATLINDSCIVLRMDYRGTGMLFTADIEWAAEAAMMELGLDLGVDILQVAHHGVDSGTSSEFLNASTPDVAIVSCGIGYGVPQVPQPGVVERLSGIPIYTTMFNGMVVGEIERGFHIRYL